MRILPSTANLQLASSEGFHWSLVSCPRFTKYNVRTGRLYPYGMENNGSSTKTSGMASPSNKALESSVVRYLNRNHDNATVSGIAILDTTAIPELHMKR